MNARVFPRVALISAMLFATLAQPVIAQDAAPLPAVVIAPAAEVDLRQSASFSGRLVAEQKVDLQARVSGFLESVEFAEGDTVTAGQTLFVIEDESYQATVAQIEGQILAAEAEETLAGLEQERTARLTARGTLSQADLDRADAALAQAKGQVATLQAQLRAAELNLSYTRVIAPFDGIVGLRTFDVGALVAPEVGTLVTLTNLDPIYVEFPISTGLLLDFQARIAAGEISPEGTVSIELPNGAAHGEQGTIDYVDAQVNQGTDTVLLRAEFANPGGNLLDGSLVQVVLAQNDGETHLAVPAQAVQRDMAGAFVMVVDDSGMVEQRRIDTGANEQGFAIIQSGLEVGEQVITEGINKVRPGIQVDAAPASGG